MPAAIIRPIEGDKMLDIVHSLSSYAFHASPPIPDKAESAEWRKSHPETAYVAAFEDTLPVACAAASPLTQNVRGALFKMTGIHNVATHPAARRKGYALSVLTRLLADQRAGGHVLSCLWPFRESFYERIGYVTFPITHKLALNIAALVPLLSADLGGTVEMALIGDAYNAYRDYVRTLQTRIHGMAMFDCADPVGAKRNRVWLALARVQGQIVGAMMYELRGEQIADFTMVVRRFVYTTSRGRYLLLAWIARHADQASKIELSLPPFEHAETWLDDLKVSAQPVALSPMGRVLDVARLSGMHTGPGRFAARISDPICPWNEGVWQFETVDGILQVSQASVAECELNIQAIAALVYGTQDAGDFAVRSWGAPSPQVQETMRAMFAAMTPYLHENF